MAEIKVTPSVLRSKADELQNGVRNLSQKMEELHEKEAQLSTMWQGSAKESFHNAFMTSYDEWKIIWMEIF